MKKEFNLGAAICTLTDLCKSLESLFGVRCTIMIYTQDSKVRVMMTHYGVNHIDELSTVSMNDESQEAFNKSCVKLFRDVAQWEEVRVSTIYNAD